MADQIVLSQGQSDVLHSFMYAHKRFTTVAAGRRWGKNFVGIVCLTQIAIGKPNTTSGFVGKTKDTVRRTCFNPMVKFLRNQFSTPDDPEALKAFKANASDLEIYFTNGSKIIMKGSAQAEAFRGEEINGMFWLDEIDFHDPGSTNNFDDNLREIYRPCTSLAQAPFLFTSTPYGVGMPFHGCWLRFDKEPKDNARFHYTSYDSDLIANEEIDSAKRDMSPTQFAQEYMAEFVSASSRVYPKFGKGNIKSDIEDRGMELYVGLDHNVSQSTAVVKQFAANKVDVEIIEEIVLQNSNTREMAIAIKSRYPGRDITMCPDPSGKARKTSADIGITDHSILEDEGFTIAAPNKAPLIVDRINNANNLIYNAEGTRRLFVSDKCPTVIEALSFHLNDELTRKPMKGGAHHYDDTNDSTTYGLWVMTGHEFSCVGSTKSIRSPAFYG